MDQDDGSLDSLMTWAIELAISDSFQSDNPSSCLGHSLCVSFFPDAGGRGLASVRDLRKGELVLRVPRAALFTTENLSRNDEKLCVALGRYSSLSSVQKLSVSLLHEMGKGNNSKWFPYLKSLPRSYTILATFGEFEKQALQVDDAVWATEKAILKTQTEWNEANALMDELKLKSQLRLFKAWLWVSATISSRALHVPWDEAGCLCPVGDLFNYAAPGEKPFDYEDTNDSTHFSLPNTISSNPNFSDTLDNEKLDFQIQRLTDGGYEEDFGAYCFYARKDYQKGEQVLLSYGMYTNLELLEHYGFLPRENPNDKVYIPLEPHIYLTSSWPRDSLFIHQNGNPSFALLCTLRLWARPPTKRRTVAHLVYSGSQLSPENETFVMQWLSKKCRAVLNNFPTSIEEDSMLVNKIRDLQAGVETGKKSCNPESEICSLLEANGLKMEESSGNLAFSKEIMRLMEKWKLAVQWRLLYKKVLEDCILFCTEIIMSLSSEADF